MKYFEPKNNRNYSAWAIIFNVFKPFCPFLIEVSIIERMTA